MLRKIFFLNAIATVRLRLRAVGTQLIVVGNQVVQASPRAGALFLTCCAPWLLRLLGIGAAVLAELARLEVAVAALTTA
jgi:hypothetical protein